MTSREGKRNAKNLGLIYSFQIIVGAVMTLENISLLGSRNSEDLIISRPNPVIDEVVIEAKGKYKVKVDHTMYKTWCLYVNNDTVHLHERGIGCSIKHGLKNTCTAIKKLKIRKEEDSLKYHLVVALGQLLLRDTSIASELRQSFWVSLQVPNANVYLSEGKEAPIYPLCANYWSTLEDHIFYLFLSDQAQTKDSRQWMKNRLHVWDRALGRSKEDVKEEQITTVMKREGTKVLDMIDRGQLLAKKVRTQDELKELFFNFVYEEITS